MSNSIRSDFHTDLAQIVLDDIQYRRANYFYFLGKTEPWGVSDVAQSVTQIDSEYENTLIRSNNLYIKKITANGVSLVTTRYNWESGTVYDKWDHTKVMEGLPFYVVTEDDRVYKCLDNFGGAPSTEVPTGTSFYPVRLGDGYLWKFMYSIPTFKRYRFASLNYIPVQTSLTDSFYNKGSVDSVVVENGGSGYSDAALTTVTVNGTTTGAGALGTIVVNSIGTITGITITDGGTGYTEGVGIIIFTSTGSNAILEPVIVGGVVTDVTITNGGVGYDALDILSFYVGGAQVVPDVSRETGEIVDVTIINPGIGYLPGMTLDVVAASGTGKYGNPEAILTPVVYEGSIQRVLIEDPGVDYPADTATTIVVQGDGVDAEFTPVIKDGSIVDVIVENPGTGYTTIVLTAIGSGTGARLTGITSASDFLSDQSIVEQTAEMGRIYAIEVANPGELYSTTTQVTITGDGSGCTAEPIIENGALYAIRVTNFGENYTYANVTISDPNRNYFGDDKTATAYAIFSPTGGHGKDAVSELFGETLSISMSLRTDGIVNSLNQDFRQYGLIKNPTEITSGKFFYGVNSLIAYEIVFEDVTDMVKDEILTRDGVKFRVVDIDDTLVTCQQLGIANVDPIGEFIALDDDARVYTAKSVTTYPTVNKYSGKLLYASNENPFSFTEEQGIVIKTFLRF